MTCVYLKRAGYAATAGLDARRASSGDEQFPGKRPIRANTGGARLRFASAPVTLVSVPLTATGKEHIIALRPG
jgi:hypothetical protein